MFKSKRIGSLFLFFALMGGISATAQVTPEPQQQQQKVEVSDEQLSKFANAFMKVQVISQKAQQQMAQVVQNEGMEIRRFNEIHTATLDPKKEVETTEEEGDLYKKIVSEIDKVQSTIQADLEAAVGAAGLSMDEYETIISGLQADPQLQQRLQAELQQ